jgi:spore maturation protein CgeB
MKFALFYHSLVSDWNNGNAHFLRGIVTELQLQGHDVRVFEPENGWSVSNLRRFFGEGAIQEFQRVYPHLKSETYKLESLDLDRTLGDREVVIVHEWNHPDLIRKMGEHRRRNPGYRLLFHDTHHRLVTCPESEYFPFLQDFDGILAYGEALREAYLARGWTRRAWTWHEAADTRVFRPLEGDKEGDLVWIGNWGDDERTAEYAEYLLGPVRSLGLNARAHGVRYPEEGIRSLRKSGIEFAGWLPNFKVPEVYSRYRVTLHIPRRPYLGLLPGIPTIRPFEALSCGIPLICSPWEDRENLFTPGKDFLVARNGEEMKSHLRSLIHDHNLSKALSDHGRNAILARHTCRHRVEELINILDAWGDGAKPQGETPDHE